MLNKRNDHTQNTYVPNKVPPIINAKTPAISEVEAPEGFRAVSISHAMMEYAKPVMEFFESGIVKDMNWAFILTTSIWNYSIELENTGIEVNRDKLIKTISITLKMSKDEAIEFYDFMIQRKKELLPADIQMVGSRTMFIKKNEHYSITEFDYNSLDISDDVLLVDSEDEEFVEMINRMDKYTQYEPDYSKMELFYFILENTCKLQF